ncbi:YpdA family putative bacillithiol disulfide reductase [Haoranjiania flava]|uniref:YpdA family putative bacillithiol disulfide reductase n=1 Tax=Haoranjiania flava TaxID=1856322 RepID=A0AAE3LKL8_9BACT|nr:YpdA family putative bacillithiol disulfide reductase [Haoranjiania flava]MCU7694708.1 YpdA family putative bacillithiol disulfide reductase [Haoranjiania flava]
MIERDILIIGGGPIGLATAIEAQKAGLSYIVVEKGALVNSLFNYPLYMTFFSSADRLEIGDIPFISVAPKPGRKEAIEYYRGVAAYRNIQIHLYEKIESVAKQGNAFISISAKHTYKTKKVIVSTGFYDTPIFLNVKGEHLPKVRHYYTEPHEYAFQKVVVVGASNSAVDAALEIFRKGGDVTMVVRGNEIGRRVKYWVKPDIENRIAEGCIKAYFNSTIEEIKERSVVVNTPDGIREIENDFVLAMTGYRPDFEMLRSFGIQLSGDGKYYPAYNKETMETNVPGLYLAGVVVGGMDTHLWFIENSRVHASLIIQHIQSQIKLTH